MLKFAEHIQYFAFPVSVFCISGLTAFDFCWIRDGNRTGGFSNPTFVYAIGLYFGWSIFCVLISIVIVFHSAVALKKALAISNTARKRLLIQLFTYVIVLSLEWTLRFVFWIMQNIYVQDHTQVGSTVRYLGLPFAILEGSRGVVDFLFWMSMSNRLQLFFNFWRKKRKGSNNIQEESPLLSSSLRTSSISSQQRRPRRQVGLQESPVSSILRYDFVCCIAWGILDSAPIDWQRQYRVSNQSNSSRFGRRRQRQGSSKVPIVQQKLTCPTAKQCLDVDFVDYAPAQFTELRLMVGITPILYAQSFHDKANGTATGMDETLTAGRSGSFFYYTSDRQYLVKTLPTTELDVMVELLPAYHSYLSEEPDSFLPRYCGLHQTRLSPEQSFISVIVMQNIFNTPQFIQIHEKYDLKGSSASRTVRKPGQAGKSRGKVPTWKDNDLHRKLRVGSERRGKILGQLGRDVHFLVSQGIMDYR